MWEVNKTPPTHEHTFNIPVMINLQELSSKLAAFGVNKSVEPKETVQVASADLMNLVWTKDVRNEKLYVVNVGGFNIKCTTDIRLALTTGATSTIGLFKETIDGKEVAWARIIKVD